MAKKPTTYKGNVARVNAALNDARKATDKAYYAARDAQVLAWRALTAAADAHIADPTTANAGRVKTARRRSNAADRRMNAARELWHFSSRIYWESRAADDREKK